jgi:hypothetical protein
VRCPAGQASLARHSGGAGAPPGSTKRPCQELADDRKAQAKRLRSLLPRRFPSAGMERGWKRCEDRWRGTYGESGACWSDKSLQISMRCRACGAPRGACRFRQRRRRHRILRFSARHPLGGNPLMLRTLRRVAATETHAPQLASPRRKPGSSLPSRLRRELDSGVRRNDGLQSRPGHAHSRSGSKVAWLIAAFERTRRRAALRR